jgi:hypothetical protein
MVNLDYFCIKQAQQMLYDDKSEDNVRKALGVLKEDGVYAMFLFLETKDKAIRKNLTGLLNTEEIRKYLLGDSRTFSEDSFKEFCDLLGEVAMELGKLLFLKKILERTLIYALYHARIGGDGSWLGKS